MYIKIKNEAKTMIDLGKYIKKKSVTRTTVTKKDKLEDFEKFRDKITEDMTSCEGVWYRYKGALLGCQLNVVRPIVMGNVVGVLCQHKDGKMIFHPRLFSDINDNAINIK